MAPHLAESPRPLEPFVDQLKRLADVRVRNCTEPPAFPGTKGFDPAAQHLDKDRLGLNAANSVP
jgi:hypothetical protein